MTGKRASNRAPIAARASRKTRRPSARARRDRAGDDVARRELGAGNPGHEASAGLVDEDRALAAHRLADERHRTVAAIERGRVELHELQVGEDRAGAGRKREPLAEAAGRVGGVLVEPADAAGRDDDRVRPEAGAGPEGPTASTSDGPRCPRRRAAAPRCPSSTSIEGVARTAAISARMTSRPAPSPPAWTMRRRQWAASRPSAKPPSPRAVETDAESRELLDRRGRGRGEAARRSRRRRARRRRRSCRRHGAPAMSSWPSAAAMPPCAQSVEPSAPSGAFEITTTGRGASCERRHQPGDAGADDDDASARRERFDGHSASIRSTARRAGAAIAGSIVTSPSIVSSARRILASVIRFMCGQRSQGRTNSTSG